MAVAHDAVIIGGGIVGLATAWQLQKRRPGWRILVLEKEPGLARHQTGHNSGVIHSGLYYAPGSLKARFCREGLEATIGLCQAHGVPYARCGKLVVAVDPVELGRLQELYRRARENGVDCRVLDAGELKALEPNVAGHGALYTGDTAIVDFRKVSAAIAAEFQARGGRIQAETEVLGLRENDAGVRIETRHGPLIAARLVACAGLHADRLARLHGIGIDFRIIPFRGEYYRLAGRLSGLVTRLIYPVPDPALPFLGIHLTRTIDGHLMLGPNAVPGFKREGYGGFNFHLRDAAAVLGYGGFWRLARTHLAAGLREYRNALSRRAFLAEARRYCPSLSLDDLHPHPAGVRAQAVMRDGTLVHDFLFRETPRSLHVCNAPSPAATSAIPIGAYIAEKLMEKG